MKRYEIRSGRNGFDALTLVERPDPQLSAGQVLVRMRALSLNYRDLPVVRGTYGAQPTVPLSDGAGEVVATASDVTRWRTGDRVAGTFMPAFVSGRITPEKFDSALGGAINGVAAELVVFGQEGLVAIPDHLSWEEASTLPCAAVTAWNALVVQGQLKAGESVLLLGTGGVSVFALQLAKLMGAQVLVTSSSHAKLERARSLGADVAIHYNETPEWDVEVHTRTGGRGADQVLDLGGSATLGKSVRAASFGGKIAVIGVVTGSQAEVAIGAILRKNLIIQGISVGSRESFEDMNRAIAQHALHPVIDRVFAFGELKEALTYLEGGTHFGKVVVTV